jgi:Flp pilus assembly protein TadG
VPFPCRRRDDRGSATVELAVVAPVMMLLLMMVVQAGLYFYARTVAAAAAHVGLDAARVEEGTAPAAEATARAFLERNAGPFAATSVGAARGVDEAEVTVAGEVPSLMFGLHVPSVQVTARAPVERVTP